MSEVFNLGSYLDYFFHSDRSETKRKNLLSQ